MSFVRWPHPTQSLAAPPTQMPSRKVWRVVNKSSRPTHRKPWDCAQATCRCAPRPSRIFPDFSQGHEQEKPALDEACEMANNVLKAGKRATEIIDRLRSLYKKAPRHRESVDVNEIIADMVVMLRG